MAHIKITKGLDIPLKGKPSGNVQTLARPQLIALDLSSFEEIRFRLLVIVGDHVAIGQPLVEDKAIPGRVWASPAGGIITEVRRGDKRRLLGIIIQVAEEERYYEQVPFDFNAATREELVDRLKIGGLFAHIRQRPFNILARPDKEPRIIFIKAIESAPFMPPAEMQVEGYELDFQKGLDALKRLTKGKVHLIYSKNSIFHPFINAKHVEKHTAEGPHPIGTFSVFIENLDPIKTSEDIIWTLNAHDVVTLGRFLRLEQYHIERVISIAGPGILPDRTGYFRARAGYPIEALILNRIQHNAPRLISGTPLNGEQVKSSDFLKFDDYSFCAIPECVEREFLHFFRAGLNKYSYSKAYLSGFFSRGAKEYDFTTTLHGEPRAFIDPSLYDKIMPLAIPTMQLVKAVMAEDYDLAEELGLLEVDSEDFALATFVCPSKMEMSEIIKKGLKVHSAEVLG